MPDVYGELANIYPAKLWENGVYTASFPEGSETLVRILAILKREGLKPWLDDRRSRRSDEYRYSITVKFSKSDFLRAPFLVWFPEPYLGEVVRITEKGKILVDTDAAEMAELEVATENSLFAGSLHMATAENEFVISDSLRKAVETARLVGFDYEDRVEFVGERKGKVPQHYWILKTMNRMPPLSKETVYVDAAGERCTGLAIPGAHIPPGELYRFDGAAIKAMGEFDVATMRESAPKEATWIMSQRFYQLCLKHKAPLVVEPVEIV